VVLERGKVGKVLQGLVGRQDDKARQGTRQGSTVTALTMPKYDAIKVRANRQQAPEVL
jgi:hypothetical protein